MGAAPCVVGVLVVNGNTDNLAVAGLELVSELAECCDLGGANEGEVLRPEEDDAPGVFVQTLGGDGGEVVFGLGCFDVSQLTGDNAGELVCGELVADGQNCMVFFFLLRAARIRCAALVLSGAHWAGLITILL